MKLTGVRILLPAFFLLVLVLVLCFLPSLNELRFDSTFISQFSQCALSTDTKLLNNNDTSSSSGLLVEKDSKVEEEEEVRILIGILTLPDSYNRRHFLRLIYGTQNLTTKAYKVDIKFVFCNLTKEDQKILVALEIMRYDDILILNCTENMNNGKTYTYFSSLPSLFNDSSSTPPYHYVMKADDDTYFRLNSFLATLLPLPRQDLYYGYVIPCTSMDPFKDYMSGMGYLVSWDLVKWISESDIPRKHVDGPEDMTFGDWMRDGQKAKNRFNMKWSMYDYPEPKTVCTHELWNNTIAVHRLKTQEMWIKTLEFFNVTNGWEKSWELGVTPWDLGRPTPILMHLHQMGVLPKRQSTNPWLCYEDVLSPLGFQAEYIDDNDLAIGSLKGREKKLGRWKRSKSRALQKNI